MRYSLGVFFTRRSWYALYNYTVKIVSLTSDTANKVNIVNVSFVSLQGLIDLPGPDEMRYEEEKKRKNRQKEFLMCSRQLLMTDYSKYMDSLASEIGCKPPGFCEYNPLYVGQSVWNINSDKFFAVVYSFTESNSE
jgi:Flavin-binding monooxygenase-like